MRLCPYEDVARSRFLGTRGTLRQWNHVRRGTGSGCDRGTPMTPSDRVMIMLSPTKESIIARKDNRKWIQVVSEVEKVFLGVPINVCKVRHLAHANKESYDCRNGIILQKDRTRVHTWVDRQRYSCSIAQLRKLIDGGIEEIGMVRFARQRGKIRKLPGLIE